MRLAIFAILYFLMSFTCYGTTTVSSQKDLHHYTLDNGLKIIVKEDHRAPVAVSMIWYNVGSADEPGGITGVSHALEHIMFKGTARYPVGVFSKTIAGLGGEENAFTNYDYTAFFEKLSKDRLPIAFELEADRMQNLLLDPNEFAKEIKVIQEERRLRTDDNPQAVAFERYMAASNLSAPYQHPIIGWMSDLESMEITDLKAWYSNFYGPNNAVLVVVGDVKADDVYHLAQVYFNNIPKKAAFKRKKQTEPPGLGAKSLEVYAPAQVPLLMFGYTAPSAVTQPDAYEPYALELISGILSVGDSGRFTKRLIRAERIANNLDVYYNLYSRYQTQFMVFGTPANNISMDTLKQKTLTEIESLKRDLVDTNELNRVKTLLIAQKTFEKDSIFGQAMEIGMLETLGLGAESSNAYIERIKAITPEQIRQTAQRYFQNNTLTEARLFPKTPTSKTLP